MRAPRVKPKVSLFNQISLIHDKKYARVKYYDFNVNYCENKNFDRLTKDNFKLHNSKLIIPKDRKIDSNLSKNPKKGRHIPKKNKVQVKYEKLRIENLEVQNKVLRSILNKFEKTLKKMTNIF